jgi:hypothetical protein
VIETTRLPIVNGTLKTNHNIRDLFIIFPV